MPPATVNTLCAWFREQQLLDDTKYMTVEEMVMIFMKIVGDKWSNRNCQSIFQHSGNTISVYVNSSNIKSVFDH